MPQTITDHIGCCFASPRMDYAGAPVLTKKLQNLWGLLPRTRIFAEDNVLYCGFVPIHSHSGFV